jgi:hypothetical protein
MFLLVAIGNGTESLAQIEFVCYNANTQQIYLMSETRHSKRLSADLDGELKLVNLLRRP